MVKVDLKREVVSIEVSYESGARNKEKAWYWQLGCKSVQDGLEEGVTAVLLGRDTFAECINKLKKGSLQNK